MNLNINGYSGLAVHFKHGTATGIMLAEDVDALTELWDKLYETCDVKPPLNIGDCRWVALLPCVSPGMLAMTVNTEHAPASGETK